MRQAQNKKGKDKIAIVLVLCFSVIALTSIFTVKANIDKINEEAAGVLVSEEAKSQESNVPNIIKPQESPSKDTTPASSEIPTVDSLEKEISKEQYLTPVKSDKTKVTNPYSMNKLIYSVTLDQYMTHCGVDIEAPEDAQVVAITDGTVTAAYNDDRYGLSVQITHSDGLVSIYSNLSTLEMVEIGDVVSKGQIIGGVGSTGLFESLEPSHLHFELLKDGSYIDPSDFIEF